MTEANDAAGDRRDDARRQSSFSWAERKSVRHDTYVDNSIESFAKLLDLIPPTSLFTTVNTRDGRLHGYVLGSLPTAGSWFTFPLEFLCNKSVPGEFFAAGICEGPQGNSEWLSLVIRAGDRALWVRASTSNILGGNYFDEASAILSGALQRWRLGEATVVAGIHADRLPEPIPEPLFADRIEENSNQFRPGPWKPRP